MGHDQGYYTIEQVNNMLADMQAQFDARCAELQEEIESLKPKHVTFSPPGGSISVYTTPRHPGSWYQTKLHLVRDAVGEDEEDS